MAFADTAVRNILQGILPCKITLAGAVAVGDLIGYSSGWKQADANASIPAKLVAGEGGASGEVITAFHAAVIEGPTGMTAGGALYLSDTAGGYAETASATSEQKVGESLSATVALVDPDRFQGKFPVAHSFASAGEANVFFTASCRCRVTKISEVHATAAGQAGTLTVERLQGTEAPGSGDDLLGTTKIDAAGTVNTVQSPALTGTAAHLVLEVGNRLALKKASGATTTLANANVTVELERA
jgi:hypothetical protein